MQLGELAYVEHDILAELCIALFYTRSEVDCSLHSYPNFHSPYLFIAFFLSRTLDLSRKESKGEGIQTRQVSLKPPEWIASIHQITP